MRANSVRSASLLAAALTLAVPGADSPARPASLEARQAGIHLAGYRESVALLREGKTREAVQTLVDRGPAWQGTAAEALKGSLKHGDGRFSAADLTAVLLLHVEAFRVRDFLYSDRLSYANAAWALSAAAGKAIPSDFVRDCHLAVLWTLQSELAIEFLVVQLGLALERFPDDPDLILTQGSLWELLAVIPDTPYLSLEPNRAIRELAKDDTRRRREWSSRGATVEVEAPRIFERCARLYQGALQREPAHEELRLRLVRVLTQAGQFEAAERAIRPLGGAGSADSAPDVRYLVAIFHGGVLQGLGRASESVAAYQTAVRLFPGCQAPQVALSAALRDAGDGAAAREVTLRMLAASRRIDCAEDPWVRYPEGQTLRLEPLLARLHEAVRR